MNPRTVDWKALFVSVGFLGWIAMLALAFAIIIGIRASTPIAGLMFAGSERTSLDAESARSQSDLLARSFQRHEENLTRDSARFIGRSVFFVPPAPPPPPPPPRPADPPREVTAPVTPAPPPPPTRYGGPDIAFVWDDRVTFVNEMTLTAGGEGRQGVEVLSTNLPWSVKLRWREVEFDVQLFERTTQQFLVPQDNNDSQAGERSGDL